MQFVGKMSVNCGVQQLDFGQIIQRLPDFVRVARFNDGCDQCHRYFFPLQRAI
jgi:hypothetical protein